MALKIKDLTVQEKLFDVTYPDTDFKVTLNYIGRDKLVRIRNNSMKKVFDKTDRQYKEEIDNDKFTSEYANEVIKGWSGLTVKVLADLMVLDLKPGTDLNELIEYSPDDAIELMKNSTLFDGFIGSKINDIDFISNYNKETKVKN